MILHFLQANTINYRNLFIIEEFAPRFAENSECLHIGDTIQKDLVKNEEKLKRLGFEITLHDNGKIYVTAFLGFQNI